MPMRPSGIYLSARIIPTVAWAQQRLGTIQVKVRWNLKLIGGVSAMKKLLLATFAAVLACGSAMAADMARPAYKAPPPLAPAPAPTWTGLYVGGGFGYAMWDADTRLDLPAFTGGTINNGGRGWLGEVGGGYDYQFPLASLNVVVGVFGDYDFGNVKGQFSPNAAIGFPSTLVGTEKEKSLWAAGGRAGWLITPQILSYWNGGYTGTRFDAVNFTTTGATPAARATIPSHNYTGWFLGGGVEAMSSWLPGLSFYTEYRFANYHETTLTIANAAAVAGALAGATVTVQPHVQTIITGVRYKFNWPH